MRGFYARECRAEKFGRPAGWTLKGESTGRRQELDLEQAGQVPVFLAKRGSHSAAEAQQVVGTEHARDSHVPGQQLAHRT